MVLRNIENRLERMVEGMFARAFRSGLQPVEVGRRLTKEMDRHRTLDTHRRFIAPNHFVVHLATSDRERFMQLHDSFVAELSASVREHADEENMRFVGRVNVVLEDEPDLGVGIFTVDSFFREVNDPAQPPCYLELPDGNRVDLGARPFTIGRMTDCDVVLADPNASRYHAELHPAGDSYELVDLGSTNGSKVNGEVVRRQLLRENDDLMFGTITLRFRLV